MEELIDEERVKQNIRIIIKNVYPKKVAVYSA
jgi:hypothetical protein